MHEPNRESPRRTTAAAACAALILVGAAATATTAGCGGHRRTDHDGRDRIVTDPILPNPYGPIDPRRDVPGTGPRPGHPVPEPTLLIMIGTGLAAVAFGARRSRDVDG